MNKEYRQSFAEQESESGTTGLEQTWRDQANTLIRIGADTKLSYATTEEYINSLPKFTPQPEEFAGRFDRPLVIETRIPLTDLAQMAGVNVMLSGEITDWPGNSFEQPSSPYTIWSGVADTDTLIPEFDHKKFGKKGISQEMLHAYTEYFSDTRNVNSIPVIRKYLKNGERGATICEALHYYIYNPEFFEFDAYSSSNIMFAVGSQVFDAEGREKRLYIGRYFSGNMYITDNGDSVDSISAQAKPLIIGREGDT